MYIAEMIIHIKGNAKASTIAKNIKSQFVDLLSKIAEDKPSMV